MKLSSSVRITTAIAGAILLAGCSGPEVRDEQPRNVLVAPAPGEQRAPTMIGPGIEGRAVRSVLRTPAARYVRNADPALIATLKNPFPPEPKKQKEKYRYVGAGDGSHRAAGKVTRATQGTIESIDTQTNIDNTGSLFIPADPHGAAGPNHVVAVTNVSIEFFQKDGTLDSSMSLKDFFGALSPPTFTFDPKVLYDQYEDRWVAITLERTDTGSGDASNTSSILLAVSDDSDPNGTWYMTRIDASVVIDGDDHWFDYPGFAVDEEAIYINGNMFQFFGGTSDPGKYGGVRLFVVDKGTAGGFYAGGSASTSRFNPIDTGAGFFEGTLQPAHTYGVVPAGTGTWLVMFSGLSNGTDEFYQIFRVDDPLGTPVFTGSFLNFGDRDNANSGFPAAPQDGVSTDDANNVGISANDRRTLDAVWRDDGLWLSHSYLANSGSDSGQVTAAWARIDTSNIGALALDQFGFIGGEEIATDTHTFFPSLAVNADGGLMVGFSASAATIYTGSYYAYRTPTDPPETIRDSVLIRAGTDYYERTFGGGENRWGDYSSAAVDPDGECFWIYNKYAITRGTSTGNDDDGRWGTAFAHFCNDPPLALVDAAEVAAGGTVTTLTGGASSVIVNDSDPDTSDLLTVNTVPVSGPDHAASFTLNDDGTFSYTHDGTANLSDAFVYEVCDDGSPIKCDTATVDITVTTDNDAPTPSDDTATVAEGGTVSSVNGGSSSVLGNDTDPELDELTVTTTPVSGPAHAASFSLDASGTFSYTHDGSETTSDSFVYEVCDDGMPSFCADATVSITVTEVNDPPNAVGETLADVAEDAGVQGYAFSALLANDDPGTGETGQSLTITAVSNPMGGTVAINGTDVEFTPASDYNGPAAFEYTVTDDGTTDGAVDPRSAVATASFTITAVNDPPVANDDDLGAVGNDVSSVAFDFSELLGNDLPGGGETGQALAVVAVGNSVGGTVAIVSGTVEFDPAMNFIGTASFDYTIEDDGTTDGASDPKQDVGTASFEIVVLNQPPDAVDDSYVIDIDQTLAADVSLNDSDSEDDPLTYSLASPPDHGTLTFDSDGTFTYVPDAGFNGEDEFKYSVSDGTSSREAVVSIRIVDLVFINGFEVQGIIAP